jgi:uncharacterized protein YndB with AHSA1/START domain
VATTRIRRVIDAPREAVYRALLDAAAVERWRTPAEMTSEVHVFEPREGGRFRVSLTYASVDGVGKTAARTDTYHGRFARLVPGQEVVEVLEFETADPALQGEMTITTTLADAGGGTELVAVHEGLPPGLSPEANELGWSESLDRLAALLEER